MEKKEINKVIIAVVAVALVVAIIGGSTFAYWQWVTSTEQQTLVNVTVQDGISMSITPTTTQTNVLYPITRDNCGLASITGHADVTVVNNTGVEARPQFYLKLKIEKDLNGDGDVVDANLSEATLGIDVNGDGDKTDTNMSENITQHYAQYIKFAVAEYYTLDPDDGSETTDYTCVNAPRTGAFTTKQTVDQYQVPVAGWVDSLLITNLSGTGEEDSAARYPILPTTSGNTDSITFNVAPNSEGTHRFKFWAWIDSSYEATNTGETVSDPLQDAKITISWSDASIVKQGA